MLAFILAASAVPAAFTALIWSTAARVAPGRRTVAASVSTLVIVAALLLSLVVQEWNSDVFVAAAMMFLTACVIVSAVIWALEKVSGPK